MYSERLEIEYYIDMIPMIHTKIISYSARKQQPPVVGIEITTLVYLI